jgi:hypothetical protein
MSSQNKISLDPAFYAFLDHQSTLGDGRQYMNLQKPVIPLGTVLSPLERLALSSYTGVGHRAAYTTSLRGKSGLYGARNIDSELYLDGDSDDNTSLTGLIDLYLPRHSGQTQRGQYSINASTDYRTSNGSACYMGNYPSKYSLN